MLKLFEDLELEYYQNYPLFNTSINLSRNINNLKVSIL